MLRRQTDYAIDRFGEGLAYGLLGILAIGAKVADAVAALRRRS